MLGPLIVDQSFHRREFAASGCGRRAARHLELLDRWVKGRPAGIRIGHIGRIGAAAAIVDPETHTVTGLRRGKVGLAIIVVVTYRHDSGVLTDPRNVGAGRDSGTVHEPGTQVQTRAIENVRLAVSIEVRNGERCPAAANAVPSNRFKGIVCLIHPDRQGAAIAGHEIDPTIAIEVGEGNDLSVGAVPSGVSITLDTAAIHQPNGDGATIAPEDI